MVSDTLCPAPNALSDNLGIIVGVPVGVTAALVVLVTGGLLYRKKKREEQQGPGGSRDNYIRSAELNTGDEFDHDPQSLAPQPLADSADMPLQKLSSSINNTNTNNNSNSPAVTIHSGSASEQKATNIVSPVQAKSSYVPPDM
jgi:hypothetical protein